VFWVELLVIFIVLFVVLQTADTAEILVLLA